MFIQKKLFIKIVLLITGKPHSCHLTRSRLDELLTPLYMRMMNYVRWLTRPYYGIPPRIAAVVLTGAGTSTPKIRQILANEFPQSEIDLSLNAREAAAYGAALLATKLIAGGNRLIRSIEVNDVASYSITIDCPIGSTESNNFEPDSSVPSDWYFLYSYASIRFDMIYKYKFSSHILQREEDSTSTRPIKCDTSARAGDQGRRHSIRYEYMHI